jgi:hypothetical protein
LNINAEEIRKIVTNDFRALWKCRDQIVEVEEKCQQLLEEYIWPK